MAIPFIKQPDAMDCGPACLCMVAKYYGKDYSLEYLRNKSFIGRDGVSLLGISKAAEMIGFHTVAGRITFDNLIRKSPFPCIVHWNQEHFSAKHCIFKSNSYIRCSKTRVQILYVLETCDAVSK